jgi:hypothetical protein
MLIGCTRIILSYYDLVESVCIAVSLKYRFCEIVSLFPTEVDSPQKMKDAGVSRSTHI